MAEIDFPFHLDPQGRTARTSRDDHIRDLIEQVLFTAPGERVNRPSFGTGLRQLVFAPASDELETATQFLVQSALQQWLGDLILIEEVQVVRGDVAEGALSVTVRYIVKQSGEVRREQFAG
jgi:uncharacterized protein